MKRTGFIAFSSFIIAVLLALQVGAMPALAAPKPPDYKPIDVGPEIRGWEATPDRISNTPEDAAAEAAQVAAATPLSECTLDTKIFLILNDYLGSYQLTYFNLVADGAGAQIWVQANLAWPAGDPRPTPVITCEQAQYMVGIFESNIYPKETSFFGMPDLHDGSYALLPSLVGLPSDYYYDAAGRQIILVSNVRDDNYYDPTYPNYIAGFYSPSFEVYFDRNVMSIDAYDWANRTGPSGTRPYLYEGVFAHEYQHLLHDDYDSDEENFVNEGLADLAEMLVGYGVANQGHIDASAKYPENSLVLWEDQGGLEILADYGHAYLFQLYLMEQFGPEFIQIEFHNPGNGISGINDSLAMIGANRTFADLYHDWSVALVIDSTKAGGRYAFKAINFHLDLGTPAAPNPQAYDTPGVGPWGTDYLWITGDPKKLAKFTFNGLDYSTFPTAWTSDGNTLWGGKGNLIDNWAIFPATGGGVLTFDTLYDIEKFWDFGFVQVSTDGGYSWSSLTNGYTTSEHDVNAHPKVVANLPGLTGSTGGAWVPMSFDLSAYAGQDVLLAFRYVTDWATAEAGWFIDNVYVDGNLISDGSSVEPFKDLTEIVPINNDYTVTFIGIRKTKSAPVYKVLTMKLDSVTEDGLFELNKILKTSNKVVLLVTFDAPEGFDRYVDYSYDFTYTNKGPKK